MLQSDWSSEFWIISQELDFFQILDLRRNIVNNTELILDQIQKKKIFFFKKLKKKLFLGHFAKFIFSKKISFCKAHPHIGL